MSRPRVITLGCRLNAFESEVMREIGSGDNEIAAAREDGAI